MPPSLKRSGKPHRPLIFVALLAAGVAAWVVGVPRPATAAPAATVPLKVLNLNIFYGGDELNLENGQFCHDADGCPATLAKVIDAIRAAAPDVVGLEEGEHNTRPIAEALGWHYSERMQVVSRLPLIDPPGGDGIYIFVQLSPGNVAAIMNVHLPSDPYGPYLVRDGGTPAEVRALEEATRMPAIQAQLRALPGLLQAGIPVFLTGDFNSPSHLDWTVAAAAARPSVRYPFDWPVSRALANAGFRDSYRVVHPDPVAKPGLTWSPGGPETVKDEVHDRIDWVLATAGAAARASTVVGESGNPDVGVAVSPWPTDHRGVLSTFDVTPGTAPIMAAVANRRLSVGDTLAVLFHARGRSGERVAIVPPGSGAAAALASRPTGSGAPADGTVIFATGSLAPGAYEAALVDAAGAVVSRSPFWVYPPGAPTEVFTSKSEYAVGEPIVVRWKNAPGMRWDWLSLASPGSGDENPNSTTRDAGYGGNSRYLMYEYTRSTIEGSGAISADSFPGWITWPPPPGNYEIRLLLDDGYRSLASSATFKVVNRTAVVGAGGGGAVATPPVKGAGLRATPARPLGGRRQADEGGGLDGPDPRATITEVRNAAGQTIFSVKPYRFDISAPLSEMATAAGTAQAEEEEKAPTHPRLPLWRIPRSGLPDPLAQPVPSAADPQSRLPFAAAAPSIGFSFDGVTQSGGVPSDSNGSVGNDQYVETVNARYQVWSLNRANNTATSILGPVAINTLWAAFGGPCQAQNAGDPIVLYDKLANRWLISQFTSAASGGLYFQCVAVSTTANATGTYARYAFAVPAGLFGDYPHFGAWPDAYYMMAHGFSSSGGGSYVAAIFAAIDRAKALAGDPTATWQVMLDPDEGGHMPADLDGVTPPPAGAPGIFLSLHGDQMYFYRMHPDFAAPANSYKILQGIAPVAPSTAACTFSATPGTCIPQPGTTRLLDALSDRLMFRAAYRNFLDHESIVISHSVDPAVAGVASGVRWYDFRLSGSPNATCATFPCTFQQGTIADIPNGRSRWMPSIAMDGAENILVAYSTSGKLNLSENHSIRYTGRAKSDPAGTMTVPEATIATGIRSNTNNSRWGDYTSLGIDPVDDCTFWHTNQYYVTSQTSWSTRNASVAYPIGTGPGECQPTTCATRPAAAPAIGSASVTGDNQIQVTWSGLLPAPGAYAVERASGACGSEGIYQPLGVVSGGLTDFTDTTVQGGLTYSYRVVAASDAAGKCQAFVASGCVNATATGTCNLKPTFAGVGTAGSRDASNCGVQLDWAPAASSCPLTPAMRYNIFRGTTPDFVPSLANRIAVCHPGPTSYVDTDNLASGATYYYVVRAEDESTGNGGECGGGNEESNGIVVSGTAYGPGLQPAPGTWADGGGDGTAFLRLNTQASGETNDPTWRFVKTATDAGANHTPGGAFAYRNAGPTAADVYRADTCATIETPPLTAGASSVNLTYWERHQIEYHWDGVVPEYQVNGVVWIPVNAPSNLPTEGCDLTDSITGWENFSCTGEPPVNACGYETIDVGINGPLASGTTCGTWSTSTSVTTYARRCHLLTGLLPGDTVQFRWRFTSDPGAEYAGFYLDDVAVTNVMLPNACTPDICAGQPNGTACSDGNACTGGEVCGAGTCGSGLPVVPAAVNDSLQFADDATTLSWSDPPGTYNVYRGTHAGGAAWAYNQACFDPHTAASSTTDTDSPPVGSMFFYLVSRDSACGESDLGSDSSGTPRPNATPCP